jgi:uncharacterized damage-inducible protein DinB
VNMQELLLMELKESFEEESWYPPLGPALKGVTAAQACWRPPGEAANTIWETLHHMLVYKEILLRRMRSEQVTGGPATNDETFAGGSPDDEAGWATIVARAEQVHRGLVEALGARSDADLLAVVGRAPLVVALSNIILHDAYHIGQLIQIRKLQGSWPARRSFD